MNNIRIIEGDLIKLARSGEFDVITHGCNCFCMMGAGIALQMAREFECNEFELEEKKYKGDINKLGNIQSYLISKGLDSVKKLAVVNSYTQYLPGNNLDYEALTLCLRKINKQFTGKKIGLPKIGCGIAGGDWKKVRMIIIQELKDCDVTIVEYKKE